MAYPESYIGTLKADHDTLKGRVDVIEPNVPAMSPQGLQLVTENWSQMRASLSVDSSAQVDAKVAVKAASTVTDDHEARLQALESAPPAGEAFPVGSIFVSAVATNPATLLGYGTWAAIGAGRCIVGQDTGDADFDTLLETGGAKTVTLTEAQIPSHTHVQNSHNHTQDAHTHNFLPRSATSGSVSSIVTGTLDTSSTISGANQPHVQPTTATNQAATAVNQNTGGGQAHSNVQPYIVVKLWHRTA